MQPQFLSHNSEIITQIKQYNKKLATIILHCVTHIVTGELKVSRQLFIDNLDPGVDYHCNKVMDNNGIENVTCVPVQSGCLLPYVLLLEIILRLTKYFGVCAEILFFSDIY